jgi:hypothetical protein
VVGDRGHRRQAEAGGVDSLWLGDHFLYRSDDATEVGYHEARTLLSAIAAVTERDAGDRGRRARGNSPIPGLIHAGRILCRCVR